MSISILVGSCSRQGNSNESKFDQPDTLGKGPNDFQEYLSSIPILTLPYKADCFSEYPDAPTVDSTLHARFSIGDLNWPYRRITLQNGYHVLMSLAPADIILPILTTYTSEGKRIDSRQLFSSYCGGEPGYYETEHISISQELIVTYLDSLWETQVDSLYNEIDSTRVLTVKKMQYQINDEGHFIDMR